MNAGGHIAVAAAVMAASTGAGRNVEARLLLGSALPDLAAMGGFRLQGSAANGPKTQDLAHGIYLHHRTDEAFHRSPWFTQRNRDLYDELQGRGMERGPARACSHVGIELLLDGELLSQRPIEEAAKAALGAIEEQRGALGPLVRSAQSSRWLAHLDRLAAHRLPADHHQPRAVAERLNRIMASRPRLAFGSGSIPTLTEALRHHQPAVDNSATALVEEIVDQLRSHLDPLSYGVQR
ncbi:MAG: hypothetical protein GY724_27545 [Actinomycetia bacterium]|nr:hypothetical protein [Actinomycetes bacterium]MCP4227597.1 hypothetical protein [Actinomycetes bacterium]MCP5034111.1 hypothetical protein [Actinomycetes bacterium]